MEQKTFFMLSLGCAKNLVDSEKIAGLIYHEGYSPATKIENADLVIVNTCAFLKEARRESLHEIAKISRKIKSMPGRRPKLIVAGCLSRYHGEKNIKNILPGVDKVFSPDNYNDIPLYLNSNNVQSENVIHPQQPNHNGEKRLITSSPHSVYLKIADGCDNKCAYCLIPTLRGPLRSKRIEDIVAEAKVLQELGAIEINLVAQDTTAYGSDLYGRRSLGKLLQMLCKIDGIHWIRILYAHPAHIDDDLLDIVAAESRICKYLDIPLQHVSSQILQRMGRINTREEIILLYEKIRKTVPNVALRTTVMAGYPGETEQDFHDLMAFLREYPFERLGAFVYSKERRTAAYKEKQHVPKEEARKRYHWIMEQQKHISRNLNRQLLGQCYRVLVDAVGPGRLSARLPSQAPEVDGNVFIKTNGKSHTAGQLLTVRISGAGAYNLLAMVVQPGNETQYGV